MSKGIIFDLDGVIIDSHNIQVKSLEFAYRTVVGEGEIPYQDFFRLSGGSLENIFAALRLPAEMAAVYRKYSRENIGLIHVNYGFLDILKELKRKDSCLILCTGKESIRTYDILKNFNLDVYFDMVICSDDVQHPKPDSESIFIAMKECQLEKENMLMVGDGINDIKCAQNAGICAIGVLWGDGLYKDLEKQNPDYLVRNIEELKDILLKWIND